MNEDKILMKQVSKFFFDILERDLIGNDVTMIVLRGHLYIDALLTTMLENFSLYPDELETDKMPFGRKVKLCVAFGLLQNDIVPAINKIGGIRNSLSHKLWANIDVTIETDFYNVIKSSKSLSDNFETYSSGWKSKMGCAIYVLWYGIFLQMGKNFGSKKHLAEFWQSTVAAKDVNLEYLDIKYLDEIKKRIEEIGEDGIEKYLSE